MEILWEPETGTCFSCGKKRALVRVYSSDRHCQTVCFGCWNASQDGCVIGSKDWDEDTAYVFSGRQSEASGAPQRAALN